MTYEIDEDIIDSINIRECIFFIGAGMSIDAGLPSGKKIADALYKKLKNHNYTKPDNYTLPRISEDFVNIISRTELEKIIRNTILNSMKDINKETYQIFAKLQPLPIDIITTNYDRLLEDAIGSENFNAIFNDKAVSKCSISKSNIYKIHGDINDIENSVITESDIQNFEEKHPNIWNKLQSLFQERIIIFLGYSVEDFHIRDMYQKIRSQLTSHMPLAYAVSPDDSNKLRLEEVGIKHIKMSAKEFMNVLIKKMDNECYNTIPFDVPYNKENDNPFSIYSTEYFPEKNWEEFINNTFIEPINFSNIIEPGNTVIEGHRGTGKSMILKYLSYDAQIKRKFNKRFDKEYIGFYLKLKYSIVSTTTNDFFKGDNENWITYFMAYVNLMIGEEIITTIKKAMKNNVLKNNFERKLVSQIFYLFFDSIENVQSDNTLDNLLLIFKKIRNELAQKHISDNDFPPDFIEQLIGLIKENIEEWKYKHVYILLDEYDNLDDYQQKVVNTLIKNRSFSYKIGVKLNEIIYDDINGKLLEKNNDYVYVTTDRFDFDKQNSLYYEYERFVENVANKRLKAYNYNNTIREILPLEKHEKLMGFENRDYSGFKNIVRLSSGIIRDFMELCKDMIYYSNPWVLKEKKNKLDVIIPNIQNTVIKIHSNLLYDNINKIIGYDEKSQKSKSNNVRILINSLAKIFQNILQGSESKEKRTVTGFQLKNIENLNQTSTNALKDATSYRLLQVPYNPRAPQNPTRYTPHERYKFHRLICPRFKLSLAERWPKEISADTFNKVLERPDETVAAITKYFVDKIPPKITSKITDYK